MLESSCIDDAAMTLVPDDFYELRHRNLFELILRLRTGGNVVDTITVFQEAKDAMTGGLDALGGITYVSSLPDQVGSVAGLPAYVGTVSR